MELAPVPRRPRSSARARLVVLVAALLPVTLLTLVPTVLGLERYVVTGSSMGGSLEHGSLAFEEVVPVSDLEVGDVITFRPSTADADAPLVTHRIVSIRDGRVVTKGDANDAVDPGELVLDQPTQARVVFAVPWVGLPFAGSWGVGRWLALGVLPMALFLGAVSYELRDRRRSRPREVASRVRALGRAV